MRSILLIGFLTAVTGASNIAGQTIRVNPTGVNVNSQNPTVVFLTFGQVPAGYVAAESMWCGELVPATPPAQGLACNPNTIYGVLPARYDRRQPTGTGGLTDIMAIPPSVVRRAYLAAVRGASAGFFYVRRFVSTEGLPDQFVNVTCRMTGGGARAPFALTNVEIKTDYKEPVLFIKSGERLPKIYAEIAYNGTGRLKGRWELVQPGEEAPTERDLLTEATLSVEQRGTQKGYTEVARFNHFLPPAGKFTLPLEMPERYPLAAEGQYILLLRIEAVDDKESDSDLEVLGVGSGVVHSGAVAAFPMPTLKFFVTGRSQTFRWETDALVFPLKNAAVDVNQPLVFTWRELPEAKFYRLEILDEQGARVFSALTDATVSSYRAPSWFRDRFGTKNLKWRVTALDENGKTIRQTEGQTLPLQ